MGTEWIKNLKAGDFVIIKTRHSSNIVQVNNVTPVGRIKIGDWCFNPNGRLRGAISSYDTPIFGRSQ